MKVPSKPAVDIDALREAIQEEYETVACEPQKGFHFHTGRSHTQRVGYNEEWLEGVPEDPSRRSREREIRSAWASFGRESGS